MSAHTKGPWSYGVRKDGSIWLSIGNPKTGPHYQGDLVASEADARLIASAPRLLEALHEQIEPWASFSRTELEYWNRVGGIDTPTLMRIFAARAAIYEAMGERAMTPWHYDATSETVFDTDTGDAIARDVSREHGALIAAAGEMREALLQISGAHFNCSMPQMWMPMQDCATQALRAVKTEPQP